MQSSMQMRAFQSRRMGAARGRAAPRTVCQAAAVAVKSVSGTMAELKAKGK